MTRLATFLAMALVHLTALAAAPSGARAATAAANAAESSALRAGRRALLQGFLRPQYMEYYGQNGPTGVNGRGTDRLAGVGASACTCVGEGKEEKCSCQGAAGGSIARAPVRPPPSSSQQQRSPASSSAAADVAKRNKVATPAPAPKKTAAKPEVTPTPPAPTPKKSAGATAAGVVSSGCGGTGRRRLASSRS
jgi:hypothetical protein